MCAFESRFSEFNSKIISRKNESVCYWDEDNKHFLNAADVAKEDIKEGIVKEIRLDRPWALGASCHGICTSITDRM